MFGFLSALLGAIWLFLGVCLLGVALLLGFSSIAAAIMFVGVLWFCWWIAGKDWGIARLIRETAPPPQASPSMKEVPKQAHCDTPRARRRTSLDDLFD